MGKRLGELAHANAFQAGVPMVRDCSTGIDQRAGMIMVAIRGRLCAPHDLTSSNGKNPSAQHVTPL